jgi:hypothetical protein
MILAKVEPLKATFCLILALFPNLIIFFFPVGRRGAIYHRPSLDATSIRRTMPRPIVIQLWF